MITLFIMLFHRSADWKKSYTVQNQQPVKSYQTPHRVIPSFLNGDANLDPKTVDSFGEEWSKFKSFSETDIRDIGSTYFDIVDDTMVNDKTVMADFGCGTGRFIKYFENKAARIVGIDPSKAIFVADALIGKNEKVELCHASISNIPFPDNYFDFGMSIGVLHHIPNTQQAMADCVKKVKQGGYFYTYIYYNFDNRGNLFKLLWRLSNVIRRCVSRLPSALKHIACDLLAIVLYMPFVWLCRLLKWLHVPEKTWRSIPLSFYENQSFYIIRNDALDRFGTPLEQRFSKKQIEQMMVYSGLSEIRFSQQPSYWHAVGKKL